MNRIKTVAVMGVGAVGAYFVWGLAEKLGENLWVVADGARAERLRTKGIVVNGKNVPLHVRTPSQAHGADLLIIATKYGALQTDLQDIAAVVAEHTLVLSVLNGVDSEEIVAERIGREHMLWSLMKIASQRVGNEVRFDPAGTLGVFFGEPGQAKPTERALAIAELFEGSGVHYSIRSDIMQDIWYKFALNVSKNLPQAMVNCGYNGYFGSDHVQWLSRVLRQEVVAVAAAQGIDIRDENNPATSNSKATRPDARFSTLQDLDACRPTEIEMFSGAVVRLGKKMGVPTPYNEFTLHLIHALEDKNAGKIQ